MRAPSGPRSELTQLGTGRSSDWLLNVRAKERRDQPFLVWAPFSGADEVWTYGRFADAVSRVAAGMQRRSIGPRDFVLIHLDNCPEFLIAWFACARIGAVAVCTNTRSSLDELTYYAGHSGAIASVTQPALASMVSAAMPAAKAMFVTSKNAGEHPPASEVPDSVDSFDTLLETDPSPPYPSNALDLASVQYTSGTTGRPKAVAWTNANIMWGAKVNAQHEGLRDTDVQLAYLPLFHTNAQSYAVLATLWVGGTVVLQPRFSVSRFWDVSLRNRCTWGSHIYFALRALGTIEAPSEHEYRLWGTGMCDHPIAARFGIRTIGWWGMTETISHPIVGDVELPNHPQTMGRAAPEYEVAVVRADGSPVEVDETGELLVRGVPGVSLFAGYLHDEAATSESFDEEGWFKSGDLVTPHGDGYVSFVERSKDMLRVGSENVAASEIERVVAGVPGVVEVAVVAGPHPMLDEVPVAFVVASEGHPNLAREIVDACRANLAEFKVPRSVRLVAELPRATLEKVAKQQLRTILLEEAQKGGSLVTEAPS